ncbi:MAG: pyridoxal 5'-phosphate synthase glutaminase subunit PdxT [Methanomassiliicoccales archaeon]|nr:pyridoxal 5'-phosphate synthase glutaminase subunit PdxT [Methanomassiliicoccales archaeon]
MKAGVVAVQGAVPEHLKVLQTTMFNLGIEGQAIPVRSGEDLDAVDCLIIPGGESTTISRLLRRFGLFDRIVQLGSEGLPMMGTCAGCILLAKEGDDGVSRTGTELLGLMDMAVERNAFGRQRESFEAPIEIKDMDTQFRAVFIRGPVISRVWGKCEVLAKHENKIVMARQNNLLALAFHPELSNDTRIHEMLLSLV